MTKSNRTISKYVCLVLYWDKRLTIASSVRRYTSCIAVSTDFQTFSGSFPISLIYASKLSFIEKPPSVKYFLSDGTFHVGK